MFDHLTEQLNLTFKNLRGQGRLTENNMQDALREVRLSLLEADVALPVIKSFIEDIKQQAVGQAVLGSLKPEQALLKIVQASLLNLLGDTRAEFNFKTQPPAVCLIVGLQGAGKTTTAAKLASFLREHDKKRVMLVSVDVHRPAAIEQLKLLAEELELPIYPSSADENPVDIVHRAINHAKKQGMDALIIDTAGRLHIDKPMMDEIISIHQAAKPIETLFVVDSMTGQDAANTAKAFNDTLPLSGIILTKTDGDARGGAALSVKQITGKPIKFIGTGEKLHAFEAFHPERMASRILGMGDILSLIEEVERKTDQKTSEKIAKKLKKGIGFDFNDCKEQLTQMSNMGGIAGMMSKLPGVGRLPKQAAGAINDKLLSQNIAIINSMTMKERRIPKIILGARKQRIARGSGTTLQDVNRLLKQFMQMQKMIKKVSKPGGMKNMMRGMSGMPGMGDFLP